MKDNQNGMAILSATSLLLIGFSGFFAGDVTKAKLLQSEIGAESIEVRRALSKKFLVAKSDGRTFSWTHIPPKDRIWEEELNSMEIDEAPADMSIRSAQRTLNEIGFELEVDGIAGPETKAVLRDFQAANGLPQTAELDRQTARALRDSTTSDLDVYSDRFPASYEEEAIHSKESSLPAFPDVLENTEPESQRSYE